MTRIHKLHAQWMTNPEYQAEYELLAPEFELAQSLIETRTKAGLTQEELAELMETTQSAIARMESGKRFPSTNTLRRFAQATGTHLKITFERDMSARQPV